MGRQHGFTLVELLLVVAIIGILLGVSTLYFAKMAQKGGIESQTKNMYVDLMAARSDALFQKSARYVALTTSGFSLYPLLDDGSGPDLTKLLLQKTLVYPVTYNGAAFSFDIRGVSNTAIVICVEPSGNPAVTDSIVISTTSVMLGKRQNGRSCDSANIDTL